MTKMDQAAVLAAIQDIFAAQFGEEALDKLTVDLRDDHAGEPGKLVVKIVPPLSATEFCARFSIIRKKVRDFLLENDTDTFPYTHIKFEGQEPAVDDLFAPIGKRRRT